MIISGKEISVKIKDQLKEEVSKIKETYPRLPKLVVILVGDNQLVRHMLGTKKEVVSILGLNQKS